VVEPFTLAIIGALAVMQALVTLTTAIIVMVAAINFGKRI
jgi:hypothetical protein